MACVPRPSGRRNFVLRVWIYWRVRTAPGGTTLAIAVPRSTTDRPLNVLTAPIEYEYVQTENGLFIRVVSQGTNDSYGGRQARSQDLFLGGASQSPRRYNLCPNKNNTNIDLEEGNISYPHLAILAARLR